MTVLVAIILVALVFDFLNGFHDAANSIATVVSTRVLSPQVAVVWAAFFNFVAAFLLGTHVAKTIGTGMIDISVVSQEVILAGLIGAIFWNLFTWYYGIPVSSSHALVGGYAGAAVAKAGFDSLILSGWTKPLAFIVLAPIIGLGLGLSMSVLVAWIFRRWHPTRLDRFFRRGQLVSAACYSLGHGGNDAQKTMGVITLGLVSTGAISSFHVPFWVVVSSAAAIALGTLFGGWRVIRTLGAKFFRVRPVHGFGAQTAASAVIAAAAVLGGPVSTTHVISSAIVGAGSADRVQMVRWGVVSNIVLSWFLTIPSVAALGALLYVIIQAINPG